MTMPVDESLQQRLRKLGVVKGLGGLKSSELREEQAVSSDDDPTQGTSPDVAGEGTTPVPRPCGDKLPGEEIVSNEGPFWLLRRSYAAEEFHGCHSFKGLASIPESTLDLLGVPDLGPHPAFLDTETTGLAGGAGTLAFLVGVGVWDGAGVDLNLIFMRSPDEEGAALGYLTEVLSRATGLVTFNGRGFDVPILEARYILNRLSPEPLALPHLDLLVVARQLWRDHLSSRRLVELERHILDIVRSERDIESSLIPWLYRQYLETGKTADMTRVFYHNEIDVLSLASLLIHVSKMVQEPMAMRLASAEWAGIGRLYDRAGQENLAMEAWRRALSGEFGELEDDCAARLWDELGLRHKRREAWSEAMAIWDAWVKAMPGAITPLVEKAKYYEWTAKDLNAALACTELALLRAARLPRGLTRYRTLAELRHRQNRLQRRLERRDE